jgi:cytochrome P450
VRELIEQILPGGELPSLPQPGENGSPMAIPTLLGADPPHHMHYRGLLNRVLNIRRARQWEPRIREIAHELIDGFDDDSAVEFVHEFAHPLPLRVVAELLGVPTDDYDLMERMFGGENVGEVIGNPNAMIIRMAEMFKAGGGAAGGGYAMFGAGDPFEDFFTARISELRASPMEGDFLSDLIEVRGDDGKQLSDNEILSIIGHFRVAGHETSTKMITAAMYYLLRSPAAMKAVQGDLSLCDNLVEEALRMEAPVQGLFRVATEDTEVGGVKIPAGSMLMLMFGAANRDPEQFDDPDEFEPTRANARAHLAFGQGEHYCVGSPFARAEGRIGYEVLLSRLGHLAFDGDKNSFDRTVSYVLRGIKRLHLTFNAISTNPQPKGAE